MSDMTDRFGEVAVLMGGWSAEREISLRSGDAVLQALRSRGVSATAVDVDHTIATRLADAGFDRAFIALHGRGGEDGTMQSLLDIMEMPYTGSGVQSSAIAMDKLRTKQIWMAEGIRTPEYMVLRGEEDCTRAIDELGLPLLVKPVLEGSSIGMSVVDDASRMSSAYAAAREYEGAVIAERWITGDEYTAAILGDRVLPLIRLVTGRTFYDYIAKYEAEDTQYICPCGLDESVEADYADASKKAFEAIGASGWGRVDFMVDAEGKAWFIEVNTVPGMTDHSLVPMAAKQVGIGFEELVVQILETTLES